MTVDNWGVDTPAVVIGLESGVAVVTGISAGVHPARRLNAIIAVAKNLGKLTIHFTSAIRCCTLGKNILGEEA